MDIKALSSAQTYQPAGNVAKAAAAEKKENSTQISDKFEKQEVSDKQTSQVYYDDMPRGKKSNFMSKVGVGLAWAACAGVGAAAGFFGGPLAGVLGAAVGAADGAAIGAAAGKGKGAATIGAVIGATAGALAASAVVGTAAAVVGGIAGAALPVALLIGIFAHAS